MPANHNRGEFPQFKSKWGARTRIRRSKKVDGLDLHPSGWSWVRIRTRVSKIWVFWQISLTWSSLKKSFYDKITQPISDSDSKDLNLSPKKSLTQIICLGIGPSSTAGAARIDTGIMVQVRDLNLVFGGKKGSRWELGMLAACWRAVKQVHICFEWLIRSASSQGC